VLLGPVNIATLCQPARQGDGKRMMEGIHTQLRPMVDRLLQSESAAAHLEQPTTLKLAGAGRWCADRGGRDEC